MDSKSRSTATWMTIITNLFLGGAFIFLSTTDRFYQVEGKESECILLRDFCNKYGILCLAIAIFTILIVVVSIITKDEGCNSGIDCMQLLSGIIGIIFIVLLMYAIYLKEPCNWLRIFSIIYLIIMSIGFCFGCCGMCVALGSTKDS